MENDKLVRLSDVTAAMNSEGYTKNMRVHKKVLSIPAVDAVPVVRCGECEWCQYDELYGQRWCDGRLVKPDHFCGYGKRREDGNTDG